MDRKELPAEIKPDVIARQISEFREMQQRRGSTAGNVLETALFLEDVFGILLDDEEMDEAHIGAGADLTAFVLNKMTGLG